MKNNPFTTLLVAALTASVLASLGIFYTNVQNGRQLGTLQPKVAQVNQQNFKINSLINDLADYSKGNPAILNVVESTGLISRTNAAQPAAAKPAAK